MGKQLFVTMKAPEIVIYGSTKNL